MSTGQICSHCGATDNFVPVQGITFCGTCGRKVLQSKPNDPPANKPPVQPLASSMQPPAPKKEASTTDRLAALKARQAPKKEVSTTSRLEALKARQNKLTNTNDAPGMSRVETATYPAQLSSKDSLTGNMLSPSLSTKRRLTVEKEKASERAKSAIVTKREHDRRLSGFVREAGLSPNTGDEKVFTITKSKLAKIEQAIRQQVKKEVQHQAEQDHSILEMEIENSRKNAELYEKENTELKQTLDDVMSSFQETLDGTKSKKNNQEQQIGQLETERSQLRTRFEHKYADTASLLKEHGALKVEYQKAQNENTITSEKLGKIETEMNDWKGKYEKLKTQASNKIRQAAVVYTGLQNSNTVKEDQVSNLSSEITQSRSKASDDETLLAATTHEVSELRKNMDAVAQTLQDKVASVNQVQAQLSNAESQYKLLYANAEEINAVNNRYKDQVVHMREESRLLTEANAQSARAELGMKRLKQTLVKLKSDNERLTTQLRSCTQIENELKTQLQSKGIDVSSMISTDTGEIEQYEEELQLMQKTLTKKEEENKELMSICEGLMSECEALKNN